MILGEVGEDGGGEARGVGAPERERVRRDLHRAVGLPPIEHRPEVALKIDRLGGRARRGPLAAADQRADRAEQSTALPAGSEQRPHQVGGGGLAVGARHAHDSQLAGGIAMEAGGQRTHCRAGGADHDFGYVQAERALDHERYGAGRDRGRGEVVAVALVAAYAKEQAPRLDLAAVVGKT